MSLKVVIASQIVFFDDKMDSAEKVEKLIFYKEREGTRASRGLPYRPAGLFVSMVWAGFIAQVMLGRVILHRLRWAGSYSIGYVGHLSKSLQCWETLIESS